MHTIAEGMNQFYIFPLLRTYFQKDSNLGIVLSISYEVLAWVYAMNRQAITPNGHFTRYQNAQIDVVMSQIAFTIKIFFRTNALQPIFFHYCYEIGTRNTVSFERCQVNLLKQNLSKCFSQKFSQKCIKIYGEGWAHQIVSPPQNLRIF